MDIRKIQDAEVTGKKVMLRVGFDVSVENGRAKETFKIKTVKETLDYLVKRNAKVGILTWLGRPGGKKDPKYSLSSIENDVRNILGYKIKLVSDCVGAEVGRIMDELGGGEVALLENVRFYPEEGDVETGRAYEDGFARQLAENFDIFINDAFSQSHRDQASIAGIPKFIPGYAGFLLQREIEKLDKVREEFERPALAIIGGAKIETKLPVIKFFEGKYDHVLVGGKIANEAIDQKIGFSEKVILPVDYAGERMDIGPNTIEKFQGLIKEARTIIWNGPLGKFEDEKYSHGTQAVFEAVANSGAFSLVGGGETLEILEKNNAMEKMSFVSTGGGAMLEYLGGKKLPGIEALLV